MLAVGWGAQGEQNIARDHVSFGEILREIIGPPQGENNTAMTESPPPPLSQWEREVDACVLECLPRSGHFTREEIEAATSSLPVGSLPEEKLDPPARRAAAATRLLLAKGVLSQTDLETVVGPREDRASPRFRSGAAVKVAAAPAPEASPSQWPLPYHSSTGLLFAAEGNVLRFKNLCHNTVAVSFGAEPAKVPAYSVAFTLNDLGLSPDASLVPGAENLTLEVDIAEPWLEAVDPIERIQNSWPRKDPATRSRTGASSHRHQRDFYLRYDYSAGTSAGGLSQQFSENLVSLLVQKKVVTMEEIQEAMGNVERTGSRGSPVSTHHRIGTMASSSKPLKKRKHD